MQLGLQPMDIDKLQMIEYCEEFVRGSKYQQIAGTEAAVSLTNFDSNTAKAVNGELGFYIMSYSALFNIAFFG